MVPCCIFYFCGLLQTSNFPDNFLIARILCGRLDISRKIFTNVIQNFTQDVTYSPIKKFVFLLWFSLHPSFVCFFSSVLMHTDYILKHKNDVLKKMKLQKLCCIFVKNYQRGNREDYCKLFKVEICDAVFVSLLR